MENISALLSSVQCGLCKSNLCNPINVNSDIEYTCKCGLKIRAILTCKACKKTFLNLPYLIRKTNYCSLDCYRAATNKKQLRICKICGKEFYAKASLIQKGFGFYCNMKCWFSLFEKQRILIRCIECGKERSVYKSIYLKHPKFCSIKCKDNNKRDLVLRVCRGCKKPFEIPRHEINRGRGTFCTWQCYKKYRGESSLELIVRQQLEKMNEPFRQEMKIGRFRLDFFLPNRNLAIECDGEYWHMIPKIKLRDERKDEFLNRFGYRILRLKGQVIIDKKFSQIFKNLLSS